MKHTNVFIVDYACSTHPHTCEVDHTSALRSKAALRAYKKYPNAKFVLGAGLGERNEGCGSLSQSMKQFLIEHGVDGYAILINDKGYNTLTETEAVHTLIQRNNGGKVVCATSLYHAPRVWCIWFFRYGITPEIFTSKYRPNLLVLVSEFCKIMPDSIRALLYRYK